MARAIEQLKQAMEVCELGALTLPDQIDALMDAARAILQEVSPLTTPNEPLAIEELREMDGEPVWIVDVGPHKWYGPCWAIVERDNCLVRTAKNWNPVFFERYGERWLA